ncbi:transcriptional regulator, partial [Micromonospora aurantiaca]|nr:transcriptional regulator [Micromonospora aurantiaca]
RTVAPEELEIHAGPGVRRRTDPVSVVLRSPHRLLDPIRT